MRIHHPRTDTGAAAIEYVLMLMVLVLGVGVGFNEFDHGVESEAVETASDISGDPSGSSTTVVSSTSTPGSTTTGSQPPVNQPPLVDVPDYTAVSVDPAESNPFALQTSISDDYTPLDVMAISITWTSGLNGDGTYTIDGVNDPPVWIEHGHTAPNPGVYYVTVCAHDGLAETCDTGTVKVSTGIVSVDTDISFWGYQWNGSEWRWRAVGNFWVRDVTGGLVSYDNVRVDLTMEAVYDDGSGPQTLTWNSVCNTGTDGHCAYWSPYISADAVSATIWVTDVTGVCIDGWDSDPATLTETSTLGGAPTGPPTTTTAPTTTTGSSTSTTPSSSSTTASTTPPPTTSTTVITTTTFADDT